MPHPIYGPPNHKLEVVRLSIHVPTTLSGHRYICEAAGDSSGKRASLWATSEIWTPEDEPTPLVVTDWVHHVVSSVLVDHPADQENLERSLRGGLDHSPPLPF